MKCVFIVYNIAIHEEILETLKKAGLRDYTRWEEVVGVGKKSGPHLNTHIWPAKNSAMIIMAEEKKTALLMEEIRELQEKMKGVGLKAFCLAVDECA
ncbi:MAG: hypothetical protein JRJ69_17215 [Deltaproteobacteria bacterium]|nr:hypothetical protein [Deltaproteobacteria bacterium]RLB22177.1 MAG: hypothetical protein DRG73_07335 [Deltaproteobacteria bacterium]